MPKKNIEFNLSQNDSYGDVNVKPDQRSVGGEMYAYTIYEHTPKTEYTTAKARVCYQSASFNVIEDETDELEKFEVQERTYQMIETYSYNRTKEVHLLVKFTIGEWTYDFFKRVDKSGVKWKQIDSVKGANLKKFGASDELSKIEYEINKSIKIQIENSETIGYPVKLIENNPGGTKPSDSPVGIDLCVDVKEVKDCLDGDDFICYVHDLKQCSSKKNNLSDVAGLRLYDRRKEIKIYKDNREDERTYLRYLPGTTKDDKLYVYFDASTNMLLLVCYDKKAYKSKSKQDPHKLFIVSRFSSCECNSKNKVEIKKKLDEIKEQLGRETTKGPSSECKNQHLASTMAQTFNSNDHGTDQHSKCDFWGDNKIYILSGGGGALGAVSIIGLVVLLYKKCVKATSAVAIDPVL